MTMISPAVARKTGISQTGKRAKAVGAHGRGEVRLARIKSLEIDAISVTNLPVAIMSMANINRASRLHLAGIIWIQLLKTVLPHNRSLNQIRFKSEATSRPISEDRTKNFISTPTCNLCYRIAVSRVGSGSALLGSCLFSED